MLKWMSPPPNPKILAHFSAISTPFPALTLCRPCPVHFFFSLSHDTPPLLLPWGLHSLQPPKPAGVGASCACAGGLPRERAQPIAAPLHRRPCTQGGASGTHCVQAQRAIPPSPQPRSPGLVSAGGGSAAPGEASCLRSRWGRFGESAQRSPRRWLAVCYPCGPGPACPRLHLGPPSDTGLWEQAVCCVTSLVL